MDLVAKFWNFCHTLRHEGIDYSDYIEELTYLLFLKIAEEKGIKIPANCKWQNLISKEQDNLLNEYNKILAELSEQDNILGDIFRHPIAKIRSSSALKKLLALIDEINWSEYNEDILGAMFEGLLEKAATESKKGAGQYFTPRPLIEAIVKVIKPNPFESPSFSISDVACGTGGFIISSYEWWKINLQGKKLSKKEFVKLSSETYFGQELVVRPRRMAQMNLYLHGISPNIKLGDTLYESYSPSSDNQYDCILTNPPFGTRGAEEIPDRHDFKIKTANKQLNFIQHVYSSLKKFGRAAIVLPDNVLTEDKATELWKHLFPLCNIHTILKLPNGTFLPYANVKAIVIFLQKGLPTKETWIFDARSNVESINKRGRPLTPNHFAEFVESYGNDPNANSRKGQLLSNNRFKSFTFDEIQKRGHNLDISWLPNHKPVENNSEPSPEMALRLAIANMQSLVVSMKKVLTLIENKF